jgi:hypothetical protein
MSVTAFSNLLIQIKAAVFFKCSIYFSINAFRYAVPLSRKSSLAVDRLWVFLATCGSDYHQGCQYEK